jgi:hypothetical protein
MSSPAVVNSLIDDVHFMAELDRMESPGQSDGAFSGDGDLFESTNLEEVPAAVAATTARMPDTPAVHSAKPALPVRLRRPATTPTRIETPHQPGMPERRETLVQPERPVQPARTIDPERRAKPPKPIQPERPAAPPHVDEIGMRMDAGEHGASSSTRPRVPALLAALTIVLCFSAGAGSAALVFHERVAQITATWRQ